MGEQPLWLKQVAGARLCPQPRVSSQSVPHQSGRQPESVLGLCDSGTPPAADLGCPASTSLYWLSACNLSGFHFPDQALPDKLRLTWEGQCPVSSVDNAPPPPPLAVK